jgi:hypothetical protein
MGNVKDLESIKIVDKGEIDVEKQLNHYLTNMSSPAKEKSIIGIDFISISIIFNITDHIYAMQYDI